MKHQCVRSAVSICFASLAAAMLSGCPEKSSMESAPGSKTAGGPRPSEILKQYKAHSPPPLTSPADVPRFIDWAGASHVDEREDARNAIAAAAGNSAVVQALIKEIERVQTLDHSRALVTLALLGETRSPEAEVFFAEFARRPLPKDGPVIEGEIINETRAAQLQAKAVDGLAYANNETSNKVVTEIITEHPSKIVRAEAINAFLWNHGDSDEARRLVSPFVRKDELILLDRVRRKTGETAESFNRKLDHFLQLHPEAIPPPPEKLPEKLQATQRRAAERTGSDVKPPDF
jgi:hypothetical protein